MCLVNKNGKVVELIRVPSGKYKKSPLTGLVFSEEEWEEIEKGI